MKDKSYLCFSILIVFCLIVVCTGQNFWKITQAENTLPKDDRQKIIWCCISREEQMKCLNFAKANERDKIRVGYQEFVIECKQAFNKDECMQLLDEEKVTLTTLDAGEVFVGGRFHSLVPIAQEELEGKLRHYYAVAVVKKNTLLDVRSLHDLRGTRACFAGVETYAGWMLPIFTLMNQGGMEIVDCNNHVKSATKFFGSSCAVNCLSDKYNPIGDNSDKLCQLCIGKIPGGRCTDSDPYAGYDGAFRCLLEVGDIAFLKHHTVPELLKSVEFSSVPVDSFELLCKDGTRKPLNDYFACNWGKVPTNAVVTSSAVSAEDRHRIQKFLEEASLKYPKYGYNATIDLDRNYHGSTQPEYDQFGNRIQPEFDQYGNRIQQKFDQYGNRIQPEYDQFGNRIEKYNNRFRRQNFGNFGTQENRDNQYGQYNQYGRDNQFNRDQFNRDQTNRDDQYNRNNAQFGGGGVNNPYGPDKNNIYNDPFKTRNEYIDPYGSSDGQGEGDRNKQENANIDPFARDPYSINPDKYGVNIDPYQTDITNYNRDRDPSFPYNNTFGGLNDTNVTIEVFSLFDSAPLYGIRGNLMFQDSARRVVGLYENQQTYSGFLGEALDVIMGIRDCPVNRMTLCVTSDAEYTKCVKMRTALKAQLLKPEMDCYKGHSQIHCMKAIQAGTADVTVLDASDVYTAGLTFDLVPFISEVYNLEQPEYYVVAVAKESDPSTELTYLRGKYTCHGGISTAAGWVYPLAFLISNGWIRPYGCNSVRAAAEYFTKSCVPGALSTEYNTGVPYDNMCDLCHGASFRYCRRDASEDYYGHTGAFRCLVEGGGHVAFVKHTTVIENTGGKRREWWARDNLNDDFELLCPDGTRAEINEYTRCNLGKVKANAIVTRGGYGYNETHINSFINLFMYAQTFYGKKSSNEFSFSMFTSDPPYSDLIFQDATRELKVIPTDERYYAAYLGNDFMRARRIVDCHAGSSSLRVSLFTLILSTIFAVLIVRK